MEATKGFDPYEVIGIIIPGTVIALLVAVEVPLFRSLLGGQGMTVGDFGLFVLVAFVFGHLVQALGNLFEPAIWLGAGLPTNHVLTPQQALLSPQQRISLEAEVAGMEGAPVELATLGRGPWRAITTRAYARIHAASRSQRIDIANRTYGLCRGLVASLSIALVWCVYAHRDQPALMAGLALMIFPPSGACGGRDSIMLERYFSSS